MCLFPIVIKSVDSYGIECNYSVPCGKCVECYKDRQNSWKIRLCEEARDHLYNYFVTLTYNEDSVPVFPDVDGVACRSVLKSDIQLWIKRCRIRLQRLLRRDIKFKYFICSEYGPNTGRPHYHGILFTDVSPTFIGTMFHDWQINHGFVKWSLIGRDSKKRTSSNPCSAVGNYVAKYCCKPPMMRSDAEIEVQRLIDDKIINPCFFLMSKGIGASYVARLRRYHCPVIDSPHERVSTICDRAFYHDGSFRFKLPRYYRDRLYRCRTPFQVDVWNPKKRKYEEKTVYRYTSKNMLARQMQTEVRNRLLAEFDLQCAIARSLYPNKSDDEICIIVEGASRVSRSLRQKDTYTKLSRFYKSNRFKNRSF